MPNAKIRLFADDTNLFLHNNDSVNLFGTANISMSQLSEWFIANRLGLNLKKTCYSIFGPKQKGRSGRSDLAYRWTASAKKHNVVNI